MNWFTSRIRRLWQWVRALPRKITIAAAVIILIAVLFGGYQFLHYYNYMQRDPNFCQSCHIMGESWNRWASSEHRSVGCHSCHHQSPLAGAKLILDFAFGDIERVERHATVPDDVCEKCHESGNPQWLQVAATAGHRQHAEGKNIACIKCHSVTLHRFSPPGPICNVCHEDKQVEMKGMAAMHCTACHRFLIEEEHLTPHRQDCLDCHQAMESQEVNWPIDAPMQYSCSECHQPHKQAKPIIDCRSCHTVEGLHLNGEHQASSCVTCHKAHEWRVTQRATCLACHPARFDHNSGALCSKCHYFKTGQMKGEHSTSSCLTCHKPHELRVTQREACLTCHSDKVEHNAGTLCGDCHYFPEQ